ncbi:MAG: hypothetical protein R2825_10315 [Saprospiraceae bacterium]
MTACPPVGNVIVSPTNPTECESTTITVAGQFNNGCEYLSDLQYIISGSTITVNATISSTQGPCTQNISPWFEDITLPGGTLSQGFYTVIFNINGTTADTEGFSVFACPTVGNISISPPNPTTCDAIIITISSQF